MDCIFKGKVRMNVNRFSMTQMQQVTFNLLKYYPTLSRVQCPLRAKSGLFRTQLFFQS